MKDYKTHYGKYLQTLSDEQVIENYVEQDSYQSSLSELELMECKIKRLTELVAKAIDKDAFDRVLQYMGYEEVK